MGIVIVKTTANGYIGRVSHREMADPVGYSKTLYVTPEYLTEEMATADAKCWKEFHMNEAAKCEHTYRTVTNSIGRCNANAVKGSTRCEFHIGEDKPKTPAQEFNIDEDDRISEFGALQDTRKVLDFIGKTLNDNPRTEIKYGELGGLLTGEEGFVLEICVGRPGSREIGTWRRFTVLKANQK